MQNIEFYQMMRGKMENDEARESFDNVFLGFVMAKMGDMEFSRAVAAAYHNSHQLNALTRGKAQLAS